MAKLLAPEPDLSTYDPCCGSGGLLISASKLFSKGRPKNYLEDVHVEASCRSLLHWKAEEGLSAIITRDQAVQSDVTLSPSRYVLVDSRSKRPSFRFAKPRKSAPVPIGG